MKTDARSFFIVAVFALFAVLRFSGSTSPAAPGSGQEWLSWSPAERNSYIQGFFEGYGSGSGAACRNLDQVFEVGQTQRVGNSPSGRCENRLDHYSKLNLKDSKLDVSAYTSVLTEFYSKHPEYQNISDSYLLSFLTDSKYKTADELYKMALRGQISTNF